MSVFPNTSIALPQGSVSVDSFAPAHLTLRADLWSVYLALPKGSIVTKLIHRAPRALAPPGPAFAGSTLPVPRARLARFRNN